MDNVLRGRRLAEQGQTNGRFTDSYLQCLHEGNGGSQPKGQVFPTRSAADPSVSPKRNFLADELAAVHSAPREVSARRGDAVVDLPGSTRRTRAGEGC